MKNLFMKGAGLAAALLMCAPVFAQTMAVTIPSGSQIMTAGSQSENNASFWLCGSGTVNVSGNGNTVYVDQQVNAIIDGNNVTVYSVSPGRLQINGNNNIVYTATASSVAINGNNNDYHTPAGLEVSLDGNNNRRFALGQVAFNYSQAPVGGCATVTGLAHTYSNAALVGPNPVRSGSVAMVQSSVKGSIVLTDVQGRQLRTYPEGSRQLSMQDVPAGMYFLHMTGTEGPAMVKLQVE